MLWHFDRTDRLTALLVRCREVQAYLFRERCDLTDPAEIAALDRRLVLVDQRFRKISAEARRCRRLAALSDAAERTVGTDQRRN